jgi:ubiquinone/menaquinone biosynthesis C-methylase UbiE
MMEINIINHYKKIIFFAFNRYKENNYTKMRNYFTEVFVFDIQKFVDIKGKKILDVGGSTGEFSKYLNENYNCDTINLDPYAENTVWETVRASAEDIPFDEDIFDLVLFRGVLEHVPNQKHQTTLNEIYRVLKKEGIAYIVIPPWFNPHAGHGLKPFHLLPFPIAKTLRNLFFKKKVNYNSLEEVSLFKTTHSKTLRNIKTSGFKVLDTKDIHLRLHFNTKIPILREILVPAVAFIAKK